MKQSLGEYGEVGIKQFLPCHSLAEAPAEEDSNQSEDPEAVSFAVRCVSGECAA